MTFDPRNVARLRDIMTGVRATPRDGRDFTWFEHRDELKGLGVHPDDIDGLDTADDAMEHNIRLADAAASGVVPGYGPKRAGGAPGTTASGGPHPSYRPPTEDIYTDGQNDFLAESAKKKGYSLGPYPSQFDLENDGRGYRTQDDAATQATYDLIKRFPQGEFVEMGVKIGQSPFNGDYRFSKGIAGRPTGIEPTQWDKVGVAQLHPKTWFNRDTTMLHTQPALGPGSLHVSGDPSSGKFKGTGDVHVARSRYGNAGQYMFSWQDGKLRYFDKNGIEVRIVHAIPNWTPR